MKRVWSCQAAGEVFAPVAQRLSRIPEALRADIKGEVVGLDGWESTSPADITAEQVEGLLQKDRRRYGLFGRDEGLLPDMARRQWARIMVLLNQDRPDALIVWHNHGISAACWVGVAKKLGIPVVRCEHGWLPDTWIWDSVGSYICEKPWGMDLIEPMADDDRIGRDVIARWQQYRHSKHNQGTREIPTELRATVGDGKFLFLAAQLQGDASMVFSDSPARNPWELYCEVRAHLNWPGPIVMKRHPRAGYENRFGRRTEPHVRLREEAGKAHGFFYLEKNVNIHDLFRFATGCATINSNVGLEAAMSGLPVWILGYAPYGGQGFTSDLRRDEVAIPKGRSAAIARYVGKLTRYLFPSECCRSDWQADDWWGGTAWQHAGLRLEAMWKQVLGLK